MTKEETARVLLAAARYAEVSAHLLMVPDLSESPGVEHALRESQNLLGFARECGAIPKREG